MTLDKTTSEPAEPSTETPEKSTPLFDVTGAVSPEPKSDNAEIPTPEPQVKKRGRPAGQKNKAKPVVTTEHAESIHRANAEMITGVLDLMRSAVSGGECPQQEQMRVGCVAAWENYLAECGAEIPAWAQVGIISTMYVAPAFATPKARGLVSGTWAKLKAWYVARGN